MSLQYAKLLLTPNGYKAGKVYAVKPTDGSGDGTVVRNTTKTRVNSSGLIESMAANVLAPDYLNGVCPALNVEGQATNYIRYSEDFTQANWDKNNIRTVQGTGSAAVVTADYAISPDGTMNADRLQLALNGGTTSGDRSGIVQINFSPLKALYKSTIWIKSNSVNSVVRLQIVTDGIGATQDITATSEWQKISLEYTNQEFRELRLYLIGGTVTSPSVDLSVWGAETQDADTSYIPNPTGGDITRSADTVTVPIPSGTTEIIEKYEDGTTNTITTIPASPYTVPVGRYEYILMR